MIALQCIWPTQMVDIFNTHIQCFWEKSSNWTLKTNQVWQWMLTWGNEPRITLKTKSMMLKDILLKSISSSVIFNGPLLSWWLPTVSLNHSDPDKHKINDNRVFKKGGGKTNGKREILWRDPRQNSPFYSYMCRIDKYVGWMYWVKKIWFWSCDVNGDIDPLPWYHFPSDCTESFVCNLILYEHCVRRLMTLDSNVTMDE